jgi:hypothetical protein
MNIMHLRGLLMLALLGDAETECGHSAKEDASCSASRRQASGSRHPDALRRSMRTVLRRLWAHAQARLALVCHATFMTV